MRWILPPSRLQVSLGMCRAAERSTYHAAGEEQGNFATPGKHCVFTTTVHHLRNDGHANVAFCWLSLVVEGCYGGSGASSSRQLSAETAACGPCKNKPVVRAPRGERESPPSGSNGVK